MPVVFTQVMAWRAACIQLALYHMAYLAPDTLYALFNYWSAYVEHMNTHMNMCSAVDVPQSVRGVSKSMYQ